MKNSKVVLFLSPEKVGHARNFWTLLRMFLRNLTGVKKCGIRMCVTCRWEFIISQKYGTNNSSCSNITPKESCHVMALRELQWDFLYTNIFYS